MFWIRNISVAKIQFEIKKPHRAAAASSLTQLPAPLSSKLDTCRELLVAIAVVGTRNSSK